MEKLQKLSKEQMKIATGGTGVWSDEFQSYMLPEVTVVGSSGFCAKCQPMLNNINNDPNSNVRADGFKYIIVTVTHYCCH